MFYFYFIFGLSMFFWYRFSFRFSIAGKNLSKCCKSSRLFFIHPANQNKLKISCHALPKPDIEVWTCRLIVLLTRCTYSIFSHFLTIYSMLMQFTSWHIDRNGSTKSVNVRAFFGSVKKIVCDWVYQNLVADLWLEMSVLLFITISRLCLLKSLICCV